MVFSVLLPHALLHNKGLGDCIVFYSYYRGFMPKKEVTNPKYFTKSTFSPL